jgi:hypothetical protein
MVGNGTDASMHGHSASNYPRGSEEFTRVLGFSDGVIAIAITLLVLNIDLPIPSGALAARQTDSTGTSAWPNSSW